MKVLLLIFFTGLSLINGDTPAHCLFSDIEGTWTIKETERIFDNSLSCDDVSAMDFPYIKTFTFTYPNTVTDELGNAGTWTLIYNQGFEFTINERSYFAFSVYEISDMTVVSYCNETFPGWSRDRTVRNWSCFTASKDDVVPVRTQEKPQINLDKPYKNDLELIDRINSLQKSWTAKEYPQFEKYTIGEMISRGGGLASRSIELPGTSPATDEQKQRAAYLPDSFDWRNVSGVNYLSPIRDQGSCGSCYAFASLAGVEARLRIATQNARQDVFSTQDVVDCSVLSQGCYGGFSYLIAGRYAQDQGLVAEDCNAYTGTDGECATDMSCTRTYVSDYDYIGGFYGGCNEELMMEALLEGGPLPVLFMVYDDFYNYYDGVYIHTELKSEFDPFVITNHVVVIVGYGVDEDTGLKYWTVKNSWGEIWGEDGYFRIIRGVDECGIESAAFEMTVIP